LDRQRAGMFVLNIHQIWQLSFHLAKVVAGIFMVLAVLFIGDADSPNRWDWPWFMTRIAIALIWFYFVQIMISKVAQWMYHGKCPMQMLESSLLDKDSSFHGHELESPAYNFLARFGPRLSPDAMMFVAIISLALLMNMIFFIPVVCWLFGWL
jgi:hypothetical protein